MIARRVALGFLCLVVPSAVRAQTAVPSRAEELLAVGRLAAAEKELYAAVRRAPRQSAARGALGRYLASRGRFKVAEVLFEEALRFGADTASVARALAAMAPYRASTERRAIPGVVLPAAIAAREEERRARGYLPSYDGAEVTLPVTMTEDALTLLRFELRTDRARVMATVDPRSEGIAIGAAGDTAFEAVSFGGQGAGSPMLIPALWLGERRLTWLDATIDPSVPAGEVRLGMDVFWQLRPIVDERAGTITFPAATTKPRVLPTTIRVPMMLRFPGLWLVPEPLYPPIEFESPRGRLLLRGSRWQLDAAASVVNVDR